MRSALMTFYMVKALCGTEATVSDFMLRFDREEEVDAEERLEMQLQKLGAFLNRGKSDG